MTIEQSASDESKENQGGVSSSEANPSTSKLGNSNDAEPATADSKERGDKDEWPLDNIKEPHKNDVLYGRGGGTNHHPGNKRYRIMVECRKVDYVSSKRLDKPLVALEIIREWRAQDPPGRFLKMDEHTGLWNDVGDKKAREKTSQALREKAPSLRKQQQGDVAYPVNEGVKYTRFDVPPNRKKGMSHPLTLQRDHSLGRDILESSERVALGNDFTWGSGLLENQQASDYHKYGTEKVESSWTGHHPVDIVQESPPVEYYDDMASPSRIQRHSHPNGLNPVYNNSMSHNVPNGMYVSKSHPVTPARSSHPSGEYDWPAQSTGSVSRSEDGSPTRWPPGEYAKTISHPQIRHECEPPPESESHRHADERDSDQPEGVGHLFSRVADMLQEPENDWRDQDRSTQGSGTYPDRYRNDEIPVEYDKWTSPSRANRPPSDGGRHTPRHSNTFEHRGVNLTHSLSGSDDTNLSAQGVKRPDDHFSGEFRPQFINTDVNAGDRVVTPTLSSSDRNKHRRRVRHSGSRNHERNSPHRLKSVPVNVDPPYNFSDSPSNRKDKSSIPKPSPVKRDTSNQNETSETKHCVKRMNRQRSIGSRNLDRVSEKEVTSVINSLEQSSLEHNVRTNGELDKPKKGDIKTLERPPKIESEDRARTYDSFDFAIDDTIGKTQNLHENSAPDVDVVSWGKVEEKDNTKWRPTSFTFSDKESSDSTLSVPPNFLNSNDRLSSIGSVEGNDMEELVKANC